MAGKDTRYVYGAYCTWHGSIYEVGQTGGKMTVDGRVIDVSIPACPHCGGPLMEMVSRERWDEKAQEFAQAHPEKPMYLGWLESLHSRCVPLRGWDWEMAYAKFVAEAGNRSVN